MKANRKVLQKILQSYIDAVEGDTGDYPELDEVLTKVVEWHRNSEKELREILEKEKGMVTLNDDDSTKDVLIGVKEILG